MAFQAAFAAAIAYSADPARKPQFKAAIEALAMVDRGALP